MVMRYFRALSLKIVTEQGGWVGNVAAAGLAPTGANTSAKTTESARSPRIVLTIAQSPTRVNRGPRLARR